MKKLLAIDGNSILNRAFYGVRPLTTASGLPTNAVYGMVNIISRHIDELSPDYFAVAFDMKAPTFRHEVYKEYKANRHGMPDELAVQRPYAYDFMKAIGAYCIEKEGFEADDILGTLATMGEKEDVHVYILTGDRDSLQLISEKTSVILATNTEPILFDTEKFREKYGILPPQFVDVKALMGDSSDNIPGVRGIGEKTALSLISKYEDLDGVFKEENLGSLSKSVKEKLAQGKESAYMSKFLATIKRDVDMGIKISDIAYNGVIKDKLLPLCRELEFTKFIKKFSLETEETDIEEVKEHFTFSEDGATSIKKGTEYAAYFDFDENRVFFCNENTVFFDTLENTVPYLSNSDYSFVVCDSKTIYHALDSLGYDFPSCKDDIMLMGYIASVAENDFSLEKQVSRKYGKEISCGEERAFYIYKLFKELSKELDDTAQTKLYREIEFPLSHVLFEMEKEGFFVCTDKISEFSKKLSAMADGYCEKIFALADEKFNVNSPKQLGHILFEVLGLPALKKTKSGYSTDVEVMEKLRPYHPIIGEILEYRKVAKLKSTYADGLIKAADEKGRVHTSFKQALTATGRLSSTEPNLQNIPIKTELGREMRKFFAAEKEDFVLIDADYSQIELRLLASISGDENMISAFKEGMDVHTSTAMKVFGVPKEEVTLELRKRAKAINFGIVYGMSAFSLSGDLHISLAAAKEYIDGYMKTYPLIGQYLSDIVKTAKKDGYVTTILGRRRYIKELSSNKKAEVAFGERVARNSPIQGSAADIIKLAMVNVAKKIKEHGYDARLIMQVHDELIIESNKNCAAEVSELLKTEMENVITLPVKLIAEVSTGKTWFDAK